MSNMNSSTPRNKIRLLPQVPAFTRSPKTTGKENVVKMSPCVHRVTFNSEIIETSIGGTQTPVKLKGDPLSPSNSQNCSELNGHTDDSTSVRAREDILSKFVTDRRSGKENHPVGHPSESKDENLKDPSNSSDNSSFESIDFNSQTTAITPRRNTTLGVPNAESPDIKDDIFKTLSRRHTLNFENHKTFTTPECYNIVNIETPLKSDLSHSLNLSKAYDDEDNCGITVAVRVRPFSQRELADSNLRNVVAMNGNETTVTLDNGHIHRFAYDFSFWSFGKEGCDFATQEYVYSSLAQPLLTKAFEGYNTCLFAYGQTGSGKSYSIMGHGSEIGIIPRFCEELFLRAEVSSMMEKAKFSMEMSFFEIYNEKIHDLLASSKDTRGKKPTLKVREHPVLGPYVEGLSTYVVNSFEDVEGWINLGNKNRATAATGMNDKSSRSHSVFTLVLTQTKTEEVNGVQHDHAITSKINLVDLAGSERQSQAQTSGERLREGANINKSLMSLGKVISVLSDLSASRKKKVFIPYRDSVLTWLLKESLGGNSRTAMIATISPSNQHADETLSTLRYAKQARAIVNNARVNEDPKARLIRDQLTIVGCNILKAGSPPSDGENLPSKLRSEIEKLRCQAGLLNEDGSVQNQIASMAEIVALKERLCSKEKEMENMTRSWQEKLMQTEEKKLAETKSLEKAGVTFKVDNRLPNLVNLNEDPQLSEMLLYVLKDGQSKVGRMKENSTHDIQFSGALIADEHCVFDNIDNVVTLVPNVEAPTYVNGNLVTESVVLHHGDRVILGGDHYFRFNHPVEVETKKANKVTITSSNEIKDYEFAKQELLRVQEARLQSEFEEEKRKAKETMLQELDRAKKEAEEELNQQKSGYEGRLAVLENELITQHKEVVKSEQSRQEADDLVQQLRKQKMMLEQEVLVGRKKKQMEDEAAQKIVGKVSPEKSKLREMLEIERQRVAEKLEKLRDRRNGLYSSNKRIKITEQVPLGKTDLYRIMLLLREANKISQLLKRNLSFSRDDVWDEERIKTVIKVTNSKLNIMTYWSLSKFEDKLMHMRDLFQSQEDSSTEDDDDVFHDPDDKWEKDEKLFSPHSPMSNGFNRFSSSNLRRRSILNSVSPGHRRDSLTFASAKTNGTGPVASIFKEIAVSVLNRLNGHGLEESIADKILQEVQNVKRSTTSISSMFQYEDHDSCRTVDGEKMKTHGIDILSSIGQLSSQFTIWYTMYESLDSTLINEIIHKMKDQLKFVGKQVILLFEGCENEIESLVVESSNRIVDNLLNICKYSGELALATDTSMVMFSEQAANPGIINPMVSHEILHSFLGGCDVFIDKTLQGGLKTLEDCEMRAQNYSDQSKNSIVYGELPQHIEIVVSTVKIMLVKCQEVQVQIDTSIRESTSLMSADYYLTNYSRSQTLISHISNLVDHISLLIQAANLVFSGEDSELQRLSRCCELVQNSAVKLKDCTECDSIGGEECSRLSECHFAQLDYAAQEVKDVTNVLIAHVQKHFTEKKITPPKSRRLLPPSPDHSRLTPSPSLLIRKNSLMRKISQDSQKLLC